MGEFGDKFRKAREKKDISLDAVSNVTKISARMLQAIEEEHFDVLPGGVFNKGFIRAYAKHLGLNDEEAITDYLACLRQAQIDAHEVWEPERPAQTRPAVPEKRRPVGPNKPAVKSPSPAQVPVQVPMQVEELPDLQLPRAEHVRPSRKGFSGNSGVEIPWRILAISAVVVVLAVILWMRRSHTAATASASTSPVKSETSPAATAPVSAPINQPSSSAPAGTAATGASPSAPSFPPQTAQPSTAIHTTTTAPESPSTSAGGGDENDVTTRPSSLPVSNPSAKSNAPLKLVIRATETSWISIVADGQSVSRETLIAPAHASVRASHEIVAKIGNAAGVTFLWNGQEIPADGAEAEVKTFVFDANGMHVVPSSQLPVQDH